MVEATVPATTPRVDADPLATGLRVLADLWLRRASHVIACVDDELVTHVYLSAAAELVGVKMRGVVYAGGEPVASNPGQEWPAIRQTASYLSRLAWWADYMYGAHLYRRGQGGSRGPVAPQDGPAPSAVVDAVAAVKAKAEQTLRSRGAIA